MAIIQGNSAVESGIAAYEIPNSLRFNSADSAYLSRTPASAGNRKTWTLSWWMKVGSVTGEKGILGVGNVDGSEDVVFLSSQRLRIRYSSGSDNTPAPLLRDVSAWYHVVLSVDTTQATAKNRLRWYVNGQYWDLDSVGYFSDHNAFPTQNFDFRINNNQLHQLGNYPRTGDYFNGYLTEMHFIDGQALTAADFGEYNSETGVWQPIAYAGTYGTNGFYLPMTQDQIVEGFNTVLWRGNGGTQRITGVGFSPDLVWVKERSEARSNWVWDTVRGSNLALSTNGTNADTAQPSLTGITADGFNISNSDASDITNKSGQNYVAWCWDAGNSTVTNNDGTITGAQVRASQTYGFSVVTASASGTSPVTIGHGLGSAPSLIIGKVRDVASTNWYVYSSSLAASDYLVLNSTSAKATSSNIWDVAPTPTVFTVGNPQNGWAGGNSGTKAYVFYCFAETGYSKFGSYTGNGSSTGPTITTGWKPAFVLIKSSSRTGTEWHIVDSTRDTVDPYTAALRANQSDAEFQTTALNAACNIQFSDTGFTVNGNVDHFNFSGETYIYAAFKDQREAAFWRDFSGNGNHWQPNNLDFNDSVVDVPTNYGTDTGVGAEVRGNYATLNPLSKLNWLSQGGTVTPSNGNLQFAVDASGNMMDATIAVSSGKWYWEVTQSAYIFNGIRSTRGIPTGDLTYRYYQNNGQIQYVPYNSTSATILTTVATSTAGDIIGIALDLDNQTISWYKNNSLLYTATSIVADEYAPCIGGAASSSGAFINFGQRPFAYAAPTGFKALCTTNLPDPAIADGSTAFNVVTYTGNATNRSIDVGMAPDFTWIKHRSSAENHNLYDILRGAGYRLESNSTDSETYYADRLTAFTSTGFDLSTGYNNTNGTTYVAWNWKAGGTGVTNTDGTITSTVSANTTAKFSIATGTTLASGTLSIGHGLGVSPAMVIYKSRDTAGQNWWVWHQSLPNAATGRALQLNTTSGEVNGAYYGTPAVSPTVVTMAAAALNSDRFVLYSFAPVEGYSAFGSYTGNGSADGPFVYTGFRPRYIMLKQTNAVSQWYVYDTARNPYNAASTRLWPNLSNAEGTGTYLFDILSNGFKFRNGNSENNGSGDAMIYAAFAETPFKYSLAR